MLALKFNYPMEKRNKLLERKFQLALATQRKDFVAKTLRQMDELVEKKIFTAEQLKCKNFIVYLIEYLIF